MEMTTTSTHVRIAPIPAPSTFKPADKIETGVSKKTLAVTLAAVDAMQKQLDKRGTPGAAIRVGVKGGGCSGFSYSIEFEDQPPRASDLVLELVASNHSTVRVFCDKKSIIYLGGSLLDYEKTMMFAGFKFKNPQEATRCGCGQSFTVA